MCPLGLVIGKKEEVSVLRYAASFFGFRCPPRLLEQYSVYLVGHVLLVCVCELVCLVSGRSIALSFVLVRRSVAPLLLSEHQVMPVHDFGAR